MTDFGQLYERYANDDLRLATVKGYLFPIARNPTFRVCGTRYDKFLSTLYKEQQNLLMQRV